MATYLPKPVSVEVEPVAQRFGLPDRYKVTSPVGRVTFLSKEELDERYEREE